MLIGNHKQRRAAAQPPACHISRRPSSPVGPVWHARVDPLRSLLTCQILSGTNKGESHLRQASLPLVQPVARPCGAKNLKIGCVLFIAAGDTVSDMSACCECADQPSCDIEAAAAAAAAAAASDNMSTSVTVASSSPLPDCQLRCALLLLASASCYLPLAASSSGV